MMPRRYPLVRYVGLAFLLGLGIQIVYAALVGWGATIGNELIGDRGAYEDLQIQGDGTPMIVTRSYTDYNDVTGRTLKGDSVPHEQLMSDRLSGSTLSGLKAPPRQFGRIAWRDRIRSFNDGGRPAVYWYLVHGGRRHSQAYLVGFDSKTKLQVGYIGTGGFRTDEPPSEELFPVDGRRLRWGGAGGGGHLTSAGPSYSGTGIPYNYYSLSEDVSGPLLPGYMIYLISRNRLWEIDPQERAVRVLMESDDLVSVGICRRGRSPGTKWNDKNAPPRPQHLAIRTPNDVLVFDPRTGESQSIAIPEKIRSNRFDFYELSGNAALFSVLGRPASGGTPIGLYWVDQQRQTVRSEQIVINRDNVPIDPRIAACGLSLLVPVPIVATIVGFVALPIRYMITGEAAGYPAALGRALSESWPALLITFALAGVMVHLCLKRQRQYALGGTRTWLVFIGLFGVPAMVGYVLCRRRPVRTACPACEQPVPRDRESCSSCDTPFPEPSLKGTEVFA